MKIREGDDVAILDDGVGQLINCVLKKDNGFCHQLLLARVEDIIEIRETNKKVRGIPTVVAIDSEATKTRFLFNMKADADYTIDVTYYPHAKKA